MGGLPWPKNFGLRSWILLLVFVSSCLSFAYWVRTRGVAHDFFEAAENKLHKPYGPLLIFLAYLVSTIFMLPLFGLHLVAGYEYGTIVGTAIVLTAEVIAGCIVFLFVRSFIRPHVRNWLNRRLGSTFKSFDQALSSGALKMVLLIRLSPVMPATLTNYAAGCTSIDFLRFAVGTLVGMFPGTCAYVNLGSVGRSAQDGALSPHAIPLYVVGVIATIYIAFELSKIARASINAKPEENHTYVV